MTTLEYEKLFFEKSIKARRNYFCTLFTELTNDASPYHPTAICEDSKVPLHRIYGISFDTKTVRPFENI